MSEAEAFLITSKEIEENNKNIKICKKDDQKGGFFRFNGWKTTIIIVLVNFRNRLIVLYE